MQLSTGPVIYKALAWQLQIYLMPSQNDIYFPNQLKWLYLYLSNDLPSYLSNKKMIQNRCPDTEEVM